MAVSDTQQYPEGASRPEDIRDIAEEIPTEEVGQGSGGIQNFDSSEQDSDGTQSTVELPVGAEHISSVEEPAAFSTTADEALIP